MLPQDMTHPYHNVFYHLFPPHKIERRKSKYTWQLDNYRRWANYFSTPVWITDTDVLLWMLMHLNWCHFLLAQKQEQRIKSQKTCFILVFANVFFKNMQFFRKLKKPTKPFLFIMYQILPTGFFSTFTISPELDACWTAFCLLPCWAL